ncbi:MAG: hypothetical protein Q8P10_02405 [bacterium]|nr:hypothetical protein [bacterium]
MSNSNKVKPEKVNGTVSLPNESSVKINQQAVDNNESEKTNEEFIKSLEKASKRELFPPLPNQNGN